jgi:hypothetical protein
MLLVIWPVLQLTFLRAVTYNFAPRAKPQSLFWDGPAIITFGIARYMNEVVSFEVDGALCIIKRVKTKVIGSRELLLI